MATGLFLFIANWIYSGLSLLQIRMISSKNNTLRNIGSYLYIYALAFFFFVELIPPVLASVYTITTGERIESPYVDFTKTEPAWDDVVGVYSVANVDNSPLQIPKNIVSESRMIFASDSTFKCNFFPIEDFQRGYVLVNAVGHWSIENVFGSWVVSMNFDTVINSKNGRREESASFGNQFRLKGNTPPYEIYVIMGDPDSWEGIALKKN